MKISKISRPWVKEESHRQNHRNGDRSYYQSTSWKSMVDFIWTRDKGICQLCLQQGIKHQLTRGTTDTSIQGTVDHKIRRNEGGSDTPENLWLVGSKCHNKKDNNAGR